MDNQQDPGPKNPEGFVKSWLSEVNDALKREKKYREKAKESVDLYEGKRADTTPFNILYSNVETLVPAIYNSLPIPMVERKFRDPDPVGKCVSEVSTRTLKFLLSNDNKDYDCFDDLMQAAVLDSIVTNRGLNRFRYSADKDATNELVVGESVRWDKFFHGYARTWKKVPWVGFEWDMSKDELKKNFPKAKFDDLRKSSGSDEDGDTDTGEDKEELTGVKTYKVYEIWDKTSGKIFFISPLAPSAPLRYIDDPLKLSGFFPVPKPLNFMRKITTLVPTPLYEQYRQQAGELNELTRRLKAIIKAIKFRGAYNSSVEGIEKMLNAEDNELVPVDNVASMPDGTGMDKLLWTVPVNELAATAQSLYQQRESVKQVIYEITGISDILRGATMASETATAQTLKNQWGTLRLKRMQREVQRYCRDAIAIIAEIAATKFELKTLQMMTGLPYLTAQQKEAIQQQQQQAAQMAQAAAQNMPPPQPGQPPQQPPQPPQLPPELAIAMQNPAWEEIQQVLKDRLLFNYKIDIETNSTIDAEAAQDKQDIAELMNAMSQFINGVGPLVQEGVFPVEVAKSMLLVITRRYNFGSQMEDAINMMQKPQPQSDPNQQAKVAAEGAKLQASQAQAQVEMLKAKNAIDLENLKAQHAVEHMQMEHTLKLQDMEVQKAKTTNALAGISAKAQASALEHQMRIAEMKQSASMVDSGES